mgnify:CR=1 FL=1
MTAECWRFVKNKCDKKLSKLFVAFLITKTAYIDGEYRAKVYFLALKLDQAEIY